MSSSAEPVQIPPTRTVSVARELCEWLARIESVQQTGQKRSWYQVVTVAQRLGVLRPALRTIVVGGTNGKGTTVHYIEQFALAQGLAVGSSYSPHLHNFNERICINGVEVSDAEIIRAFEAIESERHGVHLSYHDYATLASFCIFQHRKVDLAVLEVGVGGRYDATNIVDRDVNVISCVALDHQDMLGEDRETIGWEKVGIARCGIPLLYGDLDGVSTVLGRAQVLNCPVRQLGRDFEFQLDDYGQGTFLIRKNSTQHNSVARPTPSYPLSFTLALQALSELGLEIQESVLGTTEFLRLPGRMELIQHDGRDWLLDIAHNPAAVEHLVQHLPKVTNKEIARVLLGTLKNKDFAGIVGALQQPANRIAVTATRGKRGSDWKEQCEKFGLQCIEDLDFAFQKVIAETKPGDLILVLGSTEIVGSVRAKIAK